NNNNNNQPLHRHPSFSNASSSQQSQPIYGKYMQRMASSDNLRNGRNHHSGLFLTDSVSNSTLFSLLPTLKRKQVNPITYNSYFRMRHVESNSWVHAVKFDP